MAVANPKIRGQQAHSVLREEEADKVIFYHAWCKRCDICIAFCPKQALALDEANDPQLLRPERCNSCGLCEVLCPDFAIMVPQRRRKYKSQARKKETRY
ncbi:MAG: 4Fe-4S dicluster domain-containing protein [Dehalococcoidia bacterium]|nr:MAG: 4Fe-4S dicluster domain-containing protein [Dehalococcoidia bacterium]